MAEPAEEFARPEGAVATLRWAMEEAGVGQNAVARAIGVSSGTVSFWMTGRFRPTADSWLAALRACGYEVVVQPMTDDIIVEHHEPR
jgi:DNA-binding transcriptional regulator YdaS (Cro superfamily)